MTMNPETIPALFKALNDSLMLLTDICDVIVDESMKRGGDQPGQAANAIVLAQITGSDTARLMCDLQMLAAILGVKEAKE